MYVALPEVGSGLGFSAQDRQSGRCPYTGSSLLGGRAGSPGLLIIAIATTALVALGLRRPATTAADGPDTGDSRPIAHI